MVRIPPSLRSNAFNGSTVLRPWLTKWRSIWKPWPTSFNGSTVLRPWLTDMAEWIAKGKDLTFNGSTVLRPWLTGQRENPKVGWIAPSMGPQFLDRG